jgi:hypothetical protein
MGTAMTVSELNKYFGMGHNAKKAPRIVSIPKDTMGKLLGAASHAAWIQCFQAGNMSKGKSSIRVDFAAHKTATGNILRSALKSYVQTLVK